MFENQNSLFNEIDSASLDLVLLGPDEVVAMMAASTDKLFQASDTEKQAGTVVTLAPDLVPGGTGTSATLAVGGSVEVSIDTLGDHDWYRVTLTAGVTYTIQTSTDGSGTDAFLNLRDSTGALISSDDDAGDSVNSLISFTPTTSGTYYVDAGTFDDDTTGTYHLFLAAGAPAGDFVPGSTATTATLAVGGTVNGNIDVNGDHDYYAITLVAGQTYLFRTAGTTATTATDTILTLRDAAGNQLSTNDDAGEAGFSAIRYTATTSGTYYLDVSAFSTGTGAFNLSAFTTEPLSLFTNDQIANQLTNTYWGGPANARHFNVAPGGTITVNVTALTAAGQNLARNALALWTDATGINFSEVASGGQIVFDDNQTGAFASSTTVGNIISSSQVNVGTAWISTYGTGLNTYSFQTYIHEIGHALGLGHAGNYNGNAAYAVDAGYLNDSWATTIMSYFDQNENTYFADQGFTRQFVGTPQVADIIATTGIYGTPTTTRTGDTIYGFNNNSGRDIYSATLYPSTTYTVVDNGGIDTLDYSGFAQNQVINLNQETFSSIGARIGNVSIARGTVIENAIGGSGADLITGNSANNVLTGNAGADSLYGGDGNDTLNGAVGDAVLDGGTGTDTLVLAASGIVTATLSGFEALQLTGGAAITMTETQFNAGFAATSTLSGTGSLTINMGAGDSELYLQQLVTAGGSSVTVTANGTAGNDVIKGVIGSVNTINGGDGLDSIRGGQMVDTLNGGNGDDKIEGGQGADILTGGSGADQFRYQSTNASGVGAAADRITDFVEGTDKLGFALIDTDPVTPGDQAFSFIGTGAFHATGAAEIRYGNSGGDILVQADVNGDGIVDMEVILQGIAGHILTSGDFVL